MQNLVKSETPQNFGELIATAEMLLKSGFLPQAIKTPAQAVAIIMTGKELGIGPMASLQHINIIQGKPTISPALKLAMAYQKISGFSMSVDETTDQRAVISISRFGQKKPPIIFTIQDANRLGLSGKDNWQKQPATMLRWRAIDAALRLYAIDATLGLYSPEELNPDIKIDFSTGEVLQEPAKIAPIVIEAAKIFEPTKIEKIEKGQVDDDVDFKPVVVNITEEVKLEVEKVKKTKKAYKKPSIRVNREQIDVLDSFSIKEELKALGFRWNGEISAWSAPTSQELLRKACALTKENAEEFIEGLGL